jgi:S1-C subfamily serine protease
MATKVNVIFLSVASAFAAILFIQTAIQGSSIQALGQMVVSGISAVGEKYGQITGQNHHYLSDEQQSNIQNLKSIDLATERKAPDPPLTQIFKQVENSVVQITAKTSNPNLQIIINGNQLGGQSTRLGSGFVYDKQGHILTNNHVIDGASTAGVTFVDGNTYRAKVIGKDPSSDIAVLQITDDFSPENLAPLPIVNSSYLQVGQQVIAIGNPFGLSDTMTTGIVSQTGRLLPNPDSGFSTPGAIQTDAPINPGNSGGPLLNMLGQVVGINTAINSATGEFSGIGFAVPSNMIIKEVPTIIQTGTYNHPWLGLAGGVVTPDIAQSAGLPLNYKGVVVSSVQTGSPAEKAGLQGITQNAQTVGDIIRAIDGHPLKNIDDLINYIDLHKSIGDNVVVTVNRHGQILNLNLALQTRPPPSIQNPVSQETIIP